MPFTLIPEKGFAKAVQTEVLPSLKPFHESGTVLSAGIPVRWDWYGCKKARGSVLVSHGFTESGFKFIEMAWYFHQMGFNVMLFDHLGHGFSRPEGGDPSITDIRAFSDYLDAMGKVDAVMREKGEGPFFLYAHSMGGAVGALYVKAHPDAFRAAIFSSPMIRALTGKDGASGIGIPTAFYIAEKDDIVDVGAIRAFAARIPHARVVQIPRSKHEIYRSGNRAMGIYLRSIESFLDEQCGEGKKSD